MNFKGLFVGETCTGTGATQTLSGAYALETGVNTVPFADAYADGAVVPFVLLASNGVNRLEGEAVFDSTAGTLVLTPWVTWNGTVYEIYDGSGFTLPSGTHRIYVGLGQFNVSGVNGYNPASIGGSRQAPDNVPESDGYQNFGTAGAIFLAPAFYASPVLFNRLELRINTPGAADSTVEAGIYRYRDRPIFATDCGKPGKILVKAEFDATITGSQLVPVPLQIMPPSRTYSATWSEDTAVTVLRAAIRTHSGASGLFAFSTEGATVFRLNGQLGLVDDLSSEDTYAQEGTFRGHIVGLAYVPD